MKRFACFAAVAGMTALLVSCNNVSSMLGGAKYPADQTESYAKAVEILKEKIDTTKFKIFAMRFQEGEELSKKYDEYYFNDLRADLSDITEEEADGMIRTIEKFYKIMCERREHFDK